MASEYECPCGYFLCSKAEAKMTKTDAFYPKAKKRPLLSWRQTSGNSLRARMPKAFAHLASVPVMRAGVAGSDPALPLVAAYKEMRQKEDLLAHEGLTKHPLDHSQNSIFEPGQCA